MPTSPLSPLSWTLREIARLERGGPRPPREGGNIAMTDPQVGALQAQLAALGSWPAGLAGTPRAPVRDARTARVTVLGQPSLLGPLGLMAWLSGFYERARGGKHGLAVLAVPGGIHEDRVCLNEKYNLPYTPDMAAVYLETS
ncbi:hypothetical protein WMF39_17755 [Sorangium sp. So ce1504]|uniref:hypothetical protein n=1 Tax=Sorangium sp. So ce1504 TaxID=3133337 RepID=UPI003F5E32FA